MGERFDDGDTAYAANRNFRRHARAYLRIDTGTRHATGFRYLLIKNSLMPTN